MSDQTQVASHALTIQFSDPWTTDTLTFDFVVEVYNNPCTKGFTDMPADGDLDQPYILNSGPLEISIPVTNTECEFSVAIFSDAALT